VAEGQEILEGFHYVFPFAIENPQIPRLVDIATAASRVKETVTHLIGTMSRALSREERRQTGIRTDLYWTIPIAEQSSQILWAI
jgi:hypothetical protein